MYLERLSQLIFDQPLLIEPGKLRTILSVLEPKFKQGADIKLDAQLAAEVRESHSGRRYFVQDGVAVIPVLGTLTHRAGYLDAASGLTSYQALEDLVTSAMDDPKVSSLVFDVDSGGGAAAGAFALSDFIYEQRGRKPMVAMVNECACSAAYLLASAADEVVVNKTSRLGSIGVVTAHYDLSKRMEKEGVDVTFIYAGQHKVDGNPYEKLPEEVRSRIQASIDETYQMFVDTVARNRGLSAEAVRATEAAIYGAAEAQKVGLADRMNSMSNELNLQLLRVRKTGAASLSTTETTEESTMTDKSTTPQDQLDVDLDAVKQTAHDEGVTLGREQERERISSILTLDEAEGRSKLAKHLAFNTDMTAHAAQDLLAASAKEGGAEASVSSFEQHMNAESNPNVVVDADAQEASRDEADEIIEAGRALGLCK